MDADSGGVLEILAGFWMLTSTHQFLAYSDEPHEFVLPSILIVLGLLAVVGGIFALIHRKWRFALSGAVAAIPLPFAIIPFAAWARYFHNIPSQPIYTLGALLAFFPIALLVLSKREFK